MDIVAWIIVALIAGLIWVMLFLAVRGRRRILWCPERETLVEVDQRERPTPRTMMTGSSCSAPCGTRRGVRAETGSA